MQTLTQVCPAQSAISDSIHRRRPVEESEQESKTGQGAVVCECKKRQQKSEGHLAQKQCVLVTGRGRRGLLDMSQRWRCLLS
ncbi:unnamed protein product [Coccothraustes coccothraustes]